MFPAFVIQNLWQVYNATVVVYVWVAVCFSLEEMYSVQPRLLQQYMWGGLCVSTCFAQPS